MPKVASYKYTATNDSFTIIDMGLTIGSADAAAAVSEFVLKDGATELRRVALNGLTATATALNLPVAYNATKVIDVYAQLGGVGTGFATSSQDIAPTLVSTKYSNSNGVQTYVNSALAGNATYAYKTKPTITNVALPTTVLSAGSMTVAKFTITADAGGTVAWRKLLMTVATSSSAGVFTISGYNIYDAANESTPLTGVVVTDPAGTSTVSFVSAGQDQEISGSKTYVVKATIGGSVQTGATVAHNITTPSGYATKGTYTATALTGARFIWSDESVLGHGTSSNDWYNDYLVKNLPTDSQTLTK
jgi:hypothetical protein